MRTEDGRWARGEIRWRTILAGNEVSVDIAEVGSISIVASLTQ